MGYSWRDGLRWLNPRRFVSADLRGDAAGAVLAGGVARSRSRPAEGISLVRVHNPFAAKGLKELLTF
jgi:hypothetical protein